MKTLSYVDIFLSMLLAPTTVKLNPGNVEHSLPDKGPGSVS